MMKRKFSLYILLTIIIMSSCIKTTQIISDSNNIESIVLKRKEVIHNGNYNSMIFEGNIIDLETKEPIMFIKMILTNLENNIKPDTITTNSEGKFWFLIKKEGKYTLNINGLAYKELMINDIIFEKGKKIKLKIGLKIAGTRYIIY